MSKPAPTDIARHPIRNRLLVLLASLLLLYIVVPQFGDFSRSFAVMRQVAWTPVAGAGLLIIASYFVAGLTYRLLAMRRLPYMRTVAIQGASAFANRILPAGLGGLTLNVQYLRKQRHTLPQAVVVASTNNMLGFIGHVLLLAVALVVGRDAIWPEVRLPHVSGMAYAAVAIAAIALGVLVSIRRVRNKLTGSLRQLVRQFGLYRAHPARLGAALCSSLLLTCITITVFYLSAQALGVALTPVQAFIIFTVGVLIGTAVPTPGGLGGVEAGLVAGTVAYGYDAATALAVALLCRLLTYWVPLLPGFVLFMTNRRQFS